MTKIRLLLVPAAAAAVAAATLAGSSSASAPPVGPLPKSPVTTISTVAQELIAVALPRGQSGLVWRAARPYDSSVVRETTEANVGDLTVIVYLAVRPGTTILRFGLTNGERPKAYRAARYRVVVSKRSQ